MYKCDNCGHLFEDGEHVEWVELSGEKWAGCPLCKGGFEKIEPCKVCGSYEHDYKQEHCEKCIKDVRDRFQTFLNTQFTPEEKELLNKLYDGECL